MKLFAAVASIAIFAVLVSGEMSPTQPYNYSVTLKKGVIKLFWTFNETHITFEVHGRTTGWIGIGLSPNGGMKGADIYVGWVKNNHVYVTDRHGLGNFFPELDLQQDIDVLQGAECNGWTMFKFTRQFGACELDFDKEITADTHRLIFAWHDKDPTGNDIDEMHYHGLNRGVKSVFFTQYPKVEVVDNGSSLNTFDIFVDKVQLPSVDTYYSCRTFRTPELSEKHHIVKLEFLIDNEENVHHIVVYQCTDDFKDLGMLDRDVFCYSGLERCWNSIATWGVGNGPFILPEDVGLPIGGKNGPNIFQIEIHYDNLKLKPGIIDSSGIRITYTDQLREHDLGLIGLGASTSGIEHFIPPGVTRFRTEAHCTPQCLGQRMEHSGVDEIKIVSVMLHTHLGGRAMKLRHFRGDQELPYIASDEHYDFDYQELRFFNPHVTVKKNDRLQVECVYGTEDRKNITEAGLGTQQEMCYAFISYYPPIDVAMCVSSVPAKFAWAFFGVNQEEAKLIHPNPRALRSYEIIDAKTKVPKTMFDYLNEYDWSPANVKAFEIYYNSLLHYEICETRNSSNKFHKGLMVPKNMSPYVEPRKTCTPPDHALTQQTTANGCLTSQQ